MRRFRSAVLLFVVVAACASHDQYRKTANALPPISVVDLEQRNDVPDASGKPTCSELLFRERSIEKFKAPSGETFTIGVIELSDDGHIKDIRQRDEVFQELQRVARGGDKASPSSPGAVVVTFVHGWHHRAKVCDENLSCFRRAMEGLVEGKAARSNPGPVFGIYIGWRGESAHKLTALTFYNRKSTAHHVGSLGGRDLLLDLNRMQHDLDREVRTASGGDRFVNMVTVGHSFGGALVYSAMEALEVSEYANRHGVGYPECNGVKPLRQSVGDLVILVNPAFEAYRYRYFANDLTTPGRYSPDQRPILLTVASQADQAVGVAFPAGRALWLAWHPSAWSDASAQTFGLGHYAPYTTHKLLFNGPAAQPSATVPLTDPKAIARCGLENEVKEGLARATCECSYAVYSQGLGAMRAAAANRAMLQPISQAIDPHTPFLVASAPGNLITGHNDIYNPNFVTFLIDYINQTLPGRGVPKADSAAIPCQ